MDFNSTLVSELGPFIYGQTSWRHYQDRMDTFFDEHDVWMNSRKRDLCLFMIGTKTLLILRSLISPQNLEDVDYETVIAKLESHFYPNLSRTHYKFKFNQRKQRKLESFFDYVVALRKLLVNCNYNEPENQLKRQIIQGVRDEELRKQFCETDNATLTQIFELGLAYDNSKLPKAAPHPRNHKARINREKTCFRCKESLSRRHHNEACPFEWSVCKHCHIKGHIAKACKYKDSTCNYCGEKGHIIKLCKRKMEDERLISVL